MLAVMPISETTLKEDIEEEIYFYCLFRSFIVGVSATLLSKTVSHNLVDYRSFSFLLCFKLPLRTVLNQLSLSSYKKRMTKTPTTPQSCLLLVEHRSLTQLTSGVPHRLNQHNRKISISTGTY